MAKCLVLDVKDNVAVAVGPVAEGETLELSNGKTIVSLGEVPFAHKIAIAKMVRGDWVFKYGEVIGEATRDISPGEHVHVHNIRSLRVVRSNNE
ncbi:MAG: UxaA family hydrolase [Desulfocucumaceae bacterium]